METLSGLVPEGSALSRGSPLIWFIFIACGVLQLPLLVDVAASLFGVPRLCAAPTLAEPASAARPLLSRARVRNAGCTRCCRRCWWCS